MREIQDLMDVFPYCLLVALPIMIFLSPAAIAVGHEFPAHRLAQFELGGVSRGPKAAALSMDARALPSGAGGILILIPSSEKFLQFSEEKKEIINALQDH